MEPGLCRPVDLYKKICRIGEGTYGAVYLGKEESSGRHVALKRVLLHNEATDGFPITSLREISTLRRCSSHRNCVKLLEVVVGRSRESVFLVFEYCEHDLSELTKRFRTPFNEAEIKSLTLQLLSAVKYLHSLHILHRDIKLSNILYTNRGELKLADFGLSRTQAKKDMAMTANVVTLWYRAPEVLLGESKYSSAVDIWAIGCIFAELLLHKPLMPGNDELDQIHVAFEVLGCPTSKIWPEILDLPLLRNNVIDLAKEQRSYPFNNLQVIFPALSEEGFELLNVLLALDPRKRISAEDAECHPYFCASPYPQDVALMPTFPSQHNQLIEAANQRRVKSSVSSTISSRRHDAEAKKRLRPSNDSSQFGGVQHAQKRERETR